MAKKQGMTARLAAMRDAGFPTPCYTALRLEEMADMISEAERQTNYVGMRARLDRGDNREPPVGLAR